MNAPLDSQRHFLFYCRQLTSVLSVSVGGISQCGEFEGFNHHHIQVYRDYVRRTSQVKSLSNYFVMAGRVRSR